MCLEAGGVRGSPLEVHQVIYIRLWLWGPQVDTELCPGFLNSVLSLLWCVCVCYKTYLHLHQLGVVFHCEWQRPEKKRSLTKIDFLLV